MFRRLDGWKLAQGDLPLSPVETFGAADLFLTSSVVSPESAVSCRPSKAFGLSAVGGGAVASAPPSPGQPVHLTGSSPHQQSHPSDRCLVLLVKGFIAAPVKRSEEAFDCEQVLGLNIWTFWRHLELQHGATERFLWTDPGSCALNL